MSRVKLPRAKAGSAGAERKCHIADCDYDCGKLHNDTKRALTRQEMHSVSWWSRMPATLMSPT